MADDESKYGKALSQTQLEVLALIAQGFTNERIGKLTNRSPLTVKNHVQVILAKLGAGSRISALNIAMEQGILQCPNPTHPRCGMSINVDAASGISSSSSPVHMSVRPEVVKQLEPVNDIPIEWIECGDLQLSLETYTLRIKGVMTRATTHAVHLLYYMLQHPGKVFSRQHLLNEVWSTNAFVEERTVDTQICRLRTILNKNGYKGLVATVRPTGYGILTLPGKLP